MAFSSPARSVVRGTMESRSTYSSGAMVEPADGPQTVDRGDAQTARRVAIRSATRGGVVEIEAQASRDVDGVLDEPARVFGPFHGPVAGQQLDVGARVSHAGRVCDRADGRLDGLQLAAPHGSDIDLERGALGDDVRPRPALHHADVDADARKAPVERVKGDGLVGGLQDGAASLLRFDTRVGRASVDGEAEHQVALARGHDVAVLAGPLEDEGRIRMSVPPPR